MAPLIQVRDLSRVNNLWHHAMESLAPNNAEVFSIPFDRHDAFHGCCDALEDLAYYC